MRATSVWSVVCLCGVPVEWPDVSRETVCGACGITVGVGQWPNTDLKVVGADDKRTL